MPGREGRAGWLRHIRIPRNNEPDSRQAAKYAKVAKNGKHLHFAVLCALAAWRELFLQTLSRRGPSCSGVSGLVFGQGPSSHTARGLQNNKKHYDRSQYVIENKGTLCRNELRRTHFECQMCRLNPQIELALHARVRAGGPRRKHSARFGNEPTCDAPQGATNYKNSGNEAKEYLKTKDLTF
jgi:hypothetical protein